MTDTQADLEKLKQFATISHSRVIRSDVPKLIAELERLRASNKQMAEALEAVERHKDNPSAISSLVSAALKDGDKT